ncbi:ArsR/SmtB family transcription factor [Salinibacterium sp. PAMC 21357]|uniref:ArsR/SmtB family transcription factor n=1 Tax=Salinibacterium sp. PAMC 21357 TaxID=1112215 RepID=UPI000289A277|nr:helix-turn-helix domain-containing protein [Salinibacterium sp. PAMC 21357]
MNDDNVSPGSAATSVPLDSITRMRALAHPLRMTLLAELRITSPATVGRLAVIVGESAGTVSYHLKALAAGGFIEPAVNASGDRRETWWRASHEFTGLSAAEPETSPEFRETTNQLRHQSFDILAAELHRAVERERELPEEWVKASGSSDVAAFLTAEELAAAAAELEAVLSKWHARSDRTRAEAQAVYLIAHAIRRP